jgi:gas vesicle protein GvpO
MADTGAKARRDARHKRRSLAAEPFETVDDAASPEARDTMRHAAGAALAAAVVGGLAGAAKALRDRRSRDHGEREQESEADEQDERSEPDAPHADAEPEAAPDGDERKRDDADGPEDDERWSANARRRARAATYAEPDDDEEHASHEPDRGLPQRDIARVVELARGHVEELLGTPAESISGLERGNGSWHLMVEVVELHRIPDSTDVLSSYEVVVDDDGNLVRLDRHRRYRRAQVEEDG